MDIYKSYINKGVSDTQMVTVGRITSFVALVIACIVAPLLGALDQAFQFIQEFTGFISPGALAIFLAGFFYRRANSAGALAAAIGTFVFSALFKFLWPTVPFMDRMVLVFLLCMLLIVLFAVLGKPEKHHETIDYPKDLFKTSRTFKVCAGVIVAILAFIYIIWW
jgi:SSS family solute:Na+ symporter